MSITIDIKDEGVLTLLRDMEKLNLLHVGISNADAEYLRRKAMEAESLEIINRNADRLNAEAMDVLSYQRLDL